MLIINSFDVYFNYLNVFIALRVDKLVKQINFIDFSMFVLSNVQTFLLTTNVLNSKFEFYDHFVSIILFRIKQSCKRSLYI